MPLNDKVIYKQSCENVHCTHYTVKERTIAGKKNQSRINERRHAIAEEVKKSKYM